MSKVVTLPIAHRVPDGAQFVAQGGDGTWTWFQDEPILSDEAHVDFWCSTGGNYGNVTRTLPNPNWRDTLRKIDDPEWRKGG